VLATRDTRKLIRQAIKDGTVPDSTKLQEVADAAVAAELCTQEQAEEYVEAEEARYRVIQVDDYPPEFFSPR
jgi:hypothetical protein